MLNRRAASPNLVLRVFEHFMGQRAGKADHQIRISQLILEAAGGLYKDLRFAVVLFTEFLVLPFHTFIAAEDDYAHVGFSCICKVMGVPALS
jgi:hypothetical protein